MLSPTAVGLHFNETPTLGKHDDKSQLGNVMGSGEREMGIGFISVMKTF